MEEEVAGTGRNVKRRADRNEEILNWRKLKVSSLHQAVNTLVVLNTAGEQAYVQTAQYVLCVIESPACSSGSCTMVLACSEHHLHNISSGQKIWLPLWRLPS